MSTAGWLQFVVLMVRVCVTTPFIGRSMARVYGEDDRPAPGDRLFLRIERPIYRTCRVDPNREQRWTVYAYSVANARLQAPRVADERASISRR